MEELRQEFTVLRVTLNPSGDSVRAILRPKRQGERIIHGSVLEADFVLAQAPKAGDVVTVSIS